MLDFSVLGLTVRVAAAEPGTRALLRALYEHMNTAHGGTALRYEIGPKRPGEGTAAPEPAAAEPAEQVASFDEALVIDLQRHRRDLYFVHSAVLELGGKAVMLVARSGGGKSVCTWALLHHGFRYMSDELAPIDLAAMTVHPFPRALCLKDTPPGPYPLSGRTVVVGDTVHLPPDALPAAVCPTPMPLAAIFFLERRPDSTNGRAWRLGVAEATARIYSNSLNPLAHAAEGLDGAVRLATTLACYRLSTVDLSVVSTTIHSALAGSNS